MAFLPFGYDLQVVAISFLIASLASYVALDLAKRTRKPDGRIAIGWWLCGSLTMGTGIWCMHFIGMLAFSLPIALGYTVGLTAASWLAAVAVSAVALFVASRAALAHGTLALGAGSMGLGICAMHYIGMHALDMVPGIVWNPWLIGASALIAVGASAVALLIFFWMRTLGTVQARHSTSFQIAAALVMGLGISGMHYTGMAAANFPVNAICLSANALHGPSLSVLTAVSSVALLIVTLLASTVDARTQIRTTRLADALALANTGLQSANLELQERAFRDGLTGLPNRLLFEDRLTQAVLKSERAQHQRMPPRGGSKVGVLFVDLDRFKQINDAFGHAAGDLVLKEAARRICLAAREGDTVARLGGDEFVLLMDGVSDAADCALVARRVVEALAMPIAVGEGHAEISGSVGIALFPDHGPMRKLVMHADAAMYAAKRAGKNTCAIYDEHLNERADEQARLHEDLKRAIAAGQLELFYQPKVDATSGQIRGAEALLRWNHPQLGLLGPDTFVPIAERFGLIGAIGAWVIEEACRQLEAWADGGVRMRVAINMSVHQLQDVGLVERVSAALARRGVDPSQLLCEITESVAMGDVKMTQDTFNGLAKIGVFLSIDDFGTGYSSLSYLRQLPARQLKIDRSFVRDLETSADARAIVSAVIHLAHALGLGVVGEGVETEGQGRTLIALGCDELQGYYFARPMSATTLMAWTEGRKPPGSVDFSPSTFIEAGADTVV